MFKNFLVTALRNFHRNKLLTLFRIPGLSTGMEIGIRKVLGAETPWMC